jgi:hypothetical protein
VAGGAGEWLDGAQVRSVREERSLGEMGVGAGVERGGLCVPGQFVGELREGLLTDVFSGLSQQLERLMCSDSPLEGHRALICEVHAAAMLFQDVSGPVPGGQIDRLVWAGYGELLLRVLRGRAAAACMRVERAQAGCEQVPLAVWAQALDRRVAEISQSVGSDEEPFGASQDRRSVVPSGARRVRKLSGQG